MIFFKKHKVKNDNKMPGISNSGLTLVEVIVSITILACISIPLMAYFSDSLKYSSITAKQQKATILAQSVTESIKNQQTLLYPVSTNNALYTIPFMDNQGVFDHMAAVSTNFSHNGKPCFGLDPITKLPRGIVSYNALYYETGVPVASVATPVSGNIRKYDVDIVLSTISDLNTGDHPILYGLNDATDAVAIEGNQLQNAVMYFKGINSAYGGIYANDDDLIDGIVRTIAVEFDYVQDNAVSNNSFYQVKVYYVFACQGLRGTSPTAWDKTTSSPLNYTKIKNLENLYIMYSRLHPKTAGDWDRIMISFSDSVKNRLASGKFTVPKLFLIAQNLSSDAALFNPNYSIQVGVDPTGISYDLSNLKFNTNLITLDLSRRPQFTYASFVEVNNCYKLDPSEDIPLDKLDNPAFHENQFSGITDRGPLLRTVNIETHVYDLDSEGNRGAELASYSTSKGE